MKESEETSQRVASIASKILKMDNPKLITNDFWEDIQSVAASALTQTPDKAKITPFTMAALEAARVAAIGTHSFSSLPPRIKKP
jgi:hypothetical protein